MLDELEEAYIDPEMISDDKMISPSSFEDGKFNDTRSANRESFKLGDQTIWLDIKNAELMKKRIKDRELKL